MIIEVIYALSIICIVCELGERMTIAYDEMDCVIQQFSWYLFPIQIQRQLPIVMINAQQSVTLQCFGSIFANRESFKQVYHIGKLEMQKKNVTNVQFG